MGFRFSEIRLVLLRQRNPLRPYFGRYAKTLLADIKMPEYLIDGTGISVPNSIPVKSEKIVVVEGMSTMYRDVKNVLDIKIYIETDCNERKQRFFNRAVTRNQNEENAQKHWDYVKIAGEKYVQPAKQEADMIICGNANLEYFSQIIEYIHTITNNFQS